MYRPSSSTFTFVSSAVIACSAVALGAGCAGQVHPASPDVEGTSVVAGPAENDGDVVYVDAPPVVDIQAYPTVSYGGADVYFVGGLWYRRGPRGWAYYRREPPDLGRQRQEHLQRDHDQRWAAQPAAAEHRVQNERVTQTPASRPGVTEAQPPERRAQPEQPRRESLPASQAQGHDKAPSPRPTKRSTPVKSTPAPVRPHAGEPERR
jgi:hypothetical protein